MIWCYFSSPSRDSDRSLAGLAVARLCITLARVAWARRLSCLRNRVGLVGFSGVEAHTKLDGVFDSCFGWFRRWFAGGIAIPVLDSGSEGKQSNVGRQMRQP